MDMCHVQNAELEPKHTVKDDSGACAVFTEQGWSASQMMAAKGMVVMSRLQDALDKPPTRYQLTSRYKWKMHQGCLKSPNQNVQMYGINGQNLGQTSKILSFLLNEICVVTHLLASCGRDNLWTWMGRKYRTGNAFKFTENKDCSYRYT